MGVSNPAGPYPNPFFPTSVGVNLTANKHKYMNQPPLFKKNIQNKVGDGVFVLQEQNE